ncbi:MAG TPA: hypothetical protein VFZ47_09970 [Chitinophagaceae bacterium]
MLVPFISHIKDVIYYSILKTHTLQQGNRDPNLEQLDRKTDREWRRLSEQVMYSRSENKSCHTNPRLLSIADGDPQSPIAPVLRLWRAVILQRTKDILKLQGHLIRLYMHVSQPGRSSQRSTS